MEDVTAIGAGRESLPIAKNNGIFDTFYLSRIQNMYTYYNNTVLI